MDLICSTVKKKTSKLRTRNIVTGLAMGALVLGIYGYTFYSVSQERIMDEIDEEAKRARLKEPKTGEPIEENQAASLFMDHVLCPALNKERMDDATFHNWLCFFLIF
ncbi:cytochrome c oxidase assembly factor 3 homolog, mitochondrial-like [Xiphophorus hellerii]|uniref:cytochrome c oxidase assembly factor 3 homolog, mitochondrial-like n=1 Tax=Xiphophorus hellerii TaxID=8084 RepID=UPI0013B4660F|nr:cytochrome c oxidase assembly factor 3 homolog, mitochondrial-like [Xiphophorus hellerii]